jgi:hypothetical protein
MVERGVCDARARRVTVESLMLSRASARLRGVGIEFPPLAGVENPDAALYELLQVSEGDGADGTYNALTRLLVSYLETAEHQARRRSTPTLPGPSPVPPDATAEQ